MPMIDIRSLPLHRQPDIPQLLEGLCRNVAAAAEIAPEHVSATWSWLEPGHHVVGGRDPDHAGETGADLLVSVRVADLTTPAAITSILLAIADTLCAQTGVPRDRVVITAQTILSGHVFSDGRVETWEREQ